MSKKVTHFHPDTVLVVKSKERLLEVFYDENRCEICVGDSIEYLTITISEYEAKKMRSALNRFIDYREHLKETF